MFPNRLLLLRSDLSKVRSGPSSLVARRQWPVPSRITSFPTTIIHHPPQCHAFTSTTASSSRPFQILGVQQIALGTTDKEGTSKLWQDIFGLQPESSHRLEKENVEEDILKVGAAKSPFVVEIDLMQPIDPNKSPKVRLSRFKKGVLTK